MIYLANAFSVSMLSPMWVTETKHIRLERISAKETGEILHTCEWKSYFGHQNTAWHLSRYLHIEVPVSRGTFEMTEKDTLIVAAVEGRKRWERSGNKCPHWKFYRIFIEEEKNDQL